MFQLHQSSRAHLFLHEFLLNWLNFKLNTLLMYLTSFRRKLILHLQFKSQKVLKNIIPKENLKLLRLRLFNNLRRFRQKSNKIQRQMSKHFHKLSNRCRWSTLVPQSKPHSQFKLEHSLHHRPNQPHNRLLTKLCLAQA